MNLNHEQFKWSDEKCLENYVDWDAPACKGISLEKLKKTGFARLNVGCKDTRVPHKNGNFPTESGKCEFILKDVKNFVAGPFRQMYDDYQPGRIFLHYLIMFLS